MRSGFSFSLLLALGWIIFLTSVQGRPVRGWSPEELAAKAQIICTGTPTKIDVTGQRVDISLHGNASLPGRVVIVTIKVLGVTKGTVGPEIEMRFPTLDYKALEAKGQNGGVVNGPMQIGVEVGQRYRFYLNPAPGKSWLVGALDGDFDDGPAVQAMDPQESDANPPMLKEEAIQLASKYVRERCPSFKIVPEWIIASFSNYGKTPSWTVNLYEREPLSYPAFTSGAEIIVGMDRAIRAESWISIGLPVKTAKGLVGKSVRISYGVPSVSIVRGRLENVTNIKLRLDLSPNLQPVDVPPGVTLKFVDVPAKEVRGISVLQE